MRRAAQRLVELISRAAARHALRASTRPIKAARMDGNEAERPTKSGCCDGRRIERKQ